MITSKALKAMTLSSAARGNDRLYGNGGNDTFDYDEGDGTDRFNGGEGKDTVDATDAKTLGVSHMTAGDSIEAIKGSADGTRIKGTDGYNHLDFRKNRTGQHH